MLTAAQYSFIDSPALQKINTHYVKDLAPYVEKIKIKIVKDLATCKKLWQYFSPHKSLFDSWEFRLAFHKAHQYELYFIVVEKAGEPMALLPLWHDTANYWFKEKFYCWFGSNWNEDHAFFVKDPHYIPLLLYLAPTPLELDAICATEVQYLPPNIKFEADDPKYILDLTKFSSVEDYLNQLKKKRRYNLKRDRRLVEQYQPQIIFNRFADFNTFVKLNKSRVTEKNDESYLVDPRKVKVFRYIVNNKQKDYAARMITVVIDKKIVAVDLVATYKGIYYCLLGGAEVAKYPGLGNYLNLVEIKDAISLGMKRIDFEQEGCGWKNRWFQQIPMYKYILNT